MGVCDNSKRNEADAEWDVDVTVHIGGVAVFHGFVVVCKDGMV